MRVKKLVIFFLLVIAVTQLSSLESLGQITGSVRDAKRQPLPQVHIINTKTERGTQTDAYGKYAISADFGDTLLFTFVGMRPVEVRVERSLSPINVRMQVDDIELEEVEITARSKSVHKTQKELLAEYPKNKKLIKTSWGILDKDLSSTAIRIIDGDDLTPGGRDFLNSLQDHYPQMVVDRDDPDEPGVTKVYLGWAPTSALFDVDGFISESTPTYLSANDIERIAILVRNAAMLRYGPQGTAGVIVINTRAQTMMDDMGVIRTYDNRALADSLKRAVTYLESYRPYEPSYIEELKAAKTRKKAQGMYEIQKESYLNDPYYSLDVYEFFLSRWGNDRNSKKLFQDVRKRLPDDGSVLKALAYLQQQYGNYEAALSLYIQILMMQSWEAQALRDVANAFAGLGDFKKAWMYYTQYIDIQNQLPNTYFDAQGEDLLITTEMMGILASNGDPFLNNQDIENILDEDMRTRLVFEWNNPEADFELQFVTPEGYYDTWEHKVVKGYCSKQFFLGKENIGLWQVNIDYKGNSSELPTYFKVSIYRNFGLADQDLEVRVYKLSEENEKVQLLTLEQR